MESLKCGVFKVFIQCSCCNQVCVNEWTLALGVPTCGSEPSAAVLGMAVLYWSADPMAHLKEAGFDSCALLCFLASMSLSPSHSQERRAAAFRPLREMAASALLLEKTGRSQLECGDIVMNVPGLAPQQSTPPQTPGGSAKEDSPIAAQRFLLLCWAGRFVPSHQLSPYVSDHMSLSGSARHSWSMLLAGRGSAACVLCLWPQAH